MRVTSYDVHDEDGRPETGESDAKRQYAADYFEKNGHMIPNGVTVTPIENHECDCGWDDGTSWHSSSIAGSASSGSSFLKRTSDWMVGSLGSLSFRIGLAVASWPVHVAVAAVCFAAVCAPCIIIFWTTETRLERLWIPSDSDFLRDVDWILHNYPSDIRIQKVIVKPTQRSPLTSETENVNALDPVILNEALRIYEAVAALTVTVDGVENSLDDLCFKVPVVTGVDSFGRRRKRSASKPAGVLVVRPEQGPVTPIDNISNQTKSNDETTAGPQVFQTYSYDYYGSTDVPDNNGSIHNAGPSAEGATKDPFDDLFIDYEDLLQGDGAEEEPLVSIPRELYCPVLEDLPTACWARGIYELWKYDRSKMQNLTIENVLASLNHPDSKNGVMKSPVYGFPTDFTLYLGDVKKNASGDIVAAGGLRMEWMLRSKQKKSPEEHKNEKKTIFLEGSTPAILAWEEAFLDLMSTWKSSTPNVTVEVYYSSARSFMDVSQSAIMGDAVMLALGYFIVFVYATAVLSKRSWVENKVPVAVGSLASIIMSVLTAVGICQMAGVIYGPMNNMLPFLLLGIGIDDMFVLAEAFENVELELQKSLSNLPAGQPRPGPLRVRQLMGMAMKEAGLAITVTSLTDFAAFAIGASTTLPALSSFCIYAAVGVFILYIYQMTFFAAIFTLDVRRVRAGRYGLFPCCVSSSREIQQSAAFETAESGTQTSLSSTSRFDWVNGSFGKEVMTRILGPALTHPVGKAVVLLLGIAIVGMNSWGVSNLRRDYDPVWFLPQASHPFKFSMAERELFPLSADASVGSSSQPNSIFLGPGIKYHTRRDMAALSAMVDELREDPEARLSSLDPWSDVFRNWTVTNFNIDPVDPANSTIVDSEELWNDEDDFMKKLSLFLYSPDGYKYQRHMVIEGNLTCYGAGKDSRIKVTSIPYSHELMDDNDVQIDAMKAVKRILDKYFPPVSASSSDHGDELLIRARAFSPIYASWETNDIIEAELYRNIILAMGCIFFMTLMLIASLRTSLFVTACVFLTVVNIGGMMYFWGMSVDTISCVAIVLGIGLSVDYAAHIGHTFMNQPSPSRNERVRTALRSIGAAVFHGGFSTFLAFVVLADSDSHVFLSFFKIFVGVVGYGLFDGLILLPVVLSLLGPSPHEPPHHDEKDNQAADSTKTDQPNKPGTIFWNTKEQSAAVISEDTSSAIAEVLDTTVDKASTAEESGTSSTDSSSVSEDSSSAESTPPTIGIQSEG